MWVATVIVLLTAVLRCPLLNVGNNALTTATISLDKQQHWPLRKKRVRTEFEINAGRIANVHALHNISRASNIPIIISHGTLIGWWFNKQTLPWDTDLDAYIFAQDAREMERLSQEGALQSILSVDFRLVNDRKPTSHIEFALIHKPTGVYTDITTLRLTSDPIVLGRKVVSRPLVERPPLYAMKSSYNGLWGGHLFDPRDIDPPQKCLLHDVELWCPRDPHRVLIQEYPNYQSIVYEGRKFNQQKHCWMKETNNPGK